MLRCTDEEGASAGPGSSIKDADQVIIYLRQDEMKAVIVDASTSFNCRFGSFKMRASTHGRPIWAQGNETECENSINTILLRKPELYNFNFQPDW